MVEEQVKDHNSSYSKISRAERAELERWSGACQFNVKQISTYLTWKSVWDDTQLKYYSGYILQISILDGYFETTEEERPDWRDLYSSLCISVGTLGLMWHIFLNQTFRITRNLLQYQGYNSCTQFKFCVISSNKALPASLVSLEFCQRHLKITKISLLHKIVIYKHFSLHFSFFISG